MTLLQLQFNSSVAQRVPMLGGGGGSDDEYTCDTCARDIPIILTVRKVLEKEIKKKVA